MSGVNEGNVEKLTDALLAALNTSGCDKPEAFLSIMTLAMHLVVDQAHGEVDAALPVLIDVAEQMADQMRDWPLEDRLLELSGVAN